MDDHDLTGLSLAELRTRCKQKGLPVTGNKATLIDRLTTTPDTDPAPDTNEDGDEELFLSDDPELVTEEPQDDGDHQPDPEPTAEKTSDTGEDDLRAALVELLGLADADQLTDEALLRTVSDRITSEPDPAVLDKDSLDPGQEYERGLREGRRTAITEAVTEIIATTGRGGTLTKRVKRLAELEHG